MCLVVERQISETIPLGARHAQRAPSDRYVNRQSGDKGGEREDAHPVFEYEAAKHIQEMDRGLWLNGGGLGRHEFGFPEFLQEGDNGHDLAAGLNLDVGFTKSCDNLLRLNIDLGLNLSWG